MKLEIYVTCGYGKFSFPNEKQKFSLNQRHSPPYKQFKAVVFVHTEKVHRLLDFEQACLIATKLHMNDFSHTKYSYVWFCTH